MSMETKGPRPKHHVIEPPNTQGLTESQPRPTSKGGGAHAASEVDFSRMAAGASVTRAGGDSRQTGAFQPAKADATRVANRYNLGALECAGELDSATAAQLRSILNGIDDAAQRERATEALNAWSALF